MGSLFQGSPQTATTYSTSSTETPKWMQDAIYNQIQVAQNIANTPYQKYDAPTVAELSPLQQQAYKQVASNSGFYQNDVDQAQAGMYDLSGRGTADALKQAQSPYMRQDLVGTNLDAGQTAFGSAGRAANNIYGAAQPYLDKAGTATAQGASSSALNAASPYVSEASKSASAGIGNYMSPYQSGVMDVIAKQGARNLSENLLPGVSDSFIRAGQFGGSRMGEFGNRALRDTQESVLNKQAELANQGYGQAVNAAQADSARQAQLANTTGSLAGADSSRALQAGAQYSDIAKTQGNLANQQTSALTNLAQAQTGAGQVQQQIGLNAGQAQQTAQHQDYTRQQSALQQYAGMQQQEQAMRSADVAALEGAGAAQQNQQQQQLTAAKQQHDAEVNYPRQQMDWLNAQIRGMAPSVPQTTATNQTSTGNSYSPSPLSQLATGLYAYRGLTS